MLKVKDIRALIVKKTDLSKAVEFTHNRKKYLIGEYEMNDFNGVRFIAIENKMIFLNKDLSAQEKLQVFDEVISMSKSDKVNYEACCLSV